MVVEALTNRQIRDRLEDMLAYQRDQPILIRLVTPRIHDVALSGGQTILQKLKRLTALGADITLIINPDWTKEEHEKKILEVLTEMGVRIHAKTNLHAKIVLVQNNKEKLVLVGSANLTRMGLERQNEAGVFFLNENNDKVYDILYKYVTDLLKISNAYIGGSDFDARPEGEVQERLER